MITFWCITHSIENLKNISSIPLLIISLAHCQCWGWYLRFRILATSFDILRGLLCRPFFLLFTLMFLFHNDALLFSRIKWLLLTFTAADIAVNRICQRYPSNSKFDNLENFYFCSPQRMCLRDFMCCTC